MSDHAGVVIPLVIAVFSFVIGLLGLRRGKLIAVFEAVWVDALRVGNDLAALETRLAAPNLGHPRFVHPPSRHPSASDFLAYVGRASPRWNS